MKINYLCNINELTKKRKSDNENIFSAIYVSYVAVTRF